MGRSFLRAAGELFYLLEEHLVRVPTARADAVSPWLADFIRNDHTVLPNSKWESAVEGGERRDQDRDSLAFDSSYDRSVPAMQLVCLHDAEDAYNLRIPTRIACAYSLVEPSEELERSLGRSSSLICQHTISTATNVLCMRLMAVYSAI